MRVQHFNTDTLAPRHISTVRSTVQNSFFKDVHAIWRNLQEMDMRVIRQTDAAVKGVYVVESEKASLRGQYRARSIAMTWRRITAEQASICGGRTSERPVLELPAK